jgi:hypothetical protein
MLIKTYGLFWRAAEIDWHPGNGKTGAFRLLGRGYPGRLAGRGTRRPRLLSSAASCERKAKPFRNHSWQKRHHEYLPSWRPLICPVVRPIC